MGVSGNRAPIQPLVTLVVALTLAVGTATMLPDDLENLAASVIATNLFANNVLQAITTTDYWDVVGEYKPLLHTWSLGIEEQYYILYPVLLWVLAKGWKRTFVGVLTASALVSLLLYLADPMGYQAFYFLHYRFFELAAGGLLAVALQGGRRSIPGGTACVAALVAVLFAGESLGHEARLLLVLAATIGIIASAGPGSGWKERLLTNRAIVTIGLMSFSIYMWHQVLLAFARYFLVPEITATTSIAIVGACLVLSWLSWRLVEHPFRDPRRTSAATLTACVAAVWLASGLAAAILYAKAGVLRDVPELDIRLADAHRGLHSEYNNRVLGLDVPFVSGDRTKVLVVGNSFARDWANVLLESKRAGELEISYRRELDDEALERARQADVVYVHLGRTSDPFAEGRLARGKTWIIGTKSFGASNGIFYNARRDGDYCGQRVRPLDSVVKENLERKSAAGDRYIDLLAEVSDEVGRVPVFTPDCRFISQDTRHFTKAGAGYFAQLMHSRISFHLGLVDRHALR